MDKLKKLENCYLSSNIYTTEYLSSIANTAYNAIINCKNPDELISVLSVYFKSFLITSNNE